jgi:FimV-like protein
VTLASRLRLFARLLLVPLGLMLPLGAFAVSLGDELILSRLGDPVEVEVEVLQWEEMDLERVQISAASAAEYEVFKLTWLPVLEHLNFNLIGPDLDGKVRVLISSRDPLDEPFLELLLVLRWPGGSLRREYVLLFDPPGAPMAFTPSEAIEPPPVVVVGEPAADVVVEEPVSDAVVTESEPESVAEARTQVAIEVETLAPQAAPPRLDTTRRTYQVSAGDSLWNIARQFRPAGAGENLYQMLLGIHDLNRKAFLNGNISLLKANALLQMPSEADIAGINPDTAAAEFDRRWEAGTERYDAAEHGEAIPLFVNDIAEEETPAAIEPPLPPGTEAPPPQVDNGLIMVSVTNNAVPLQLAPATDPAPVSDTRDDDRVLPSAVPEPASSEGLAIEAETATVASAASAEATVALPTTVTNTSRVVTTAELETELAAMRTRRETAEALARQLQESLQRAQAERKAQNTLLAPENLPLAGGALALLLTLVAGVVFMLKLAGELRMARIEGALAPRRQRRVPVREDSIRGEPRIESALGKVARPQDPEVQDASQIDVIELDAPLENAQAASPDTPADDEPAPQAERADPKDLFARMDDMLGAAQKSPQK